MAKYRARLPLDLVRAGISRETVVSRSPVHRWRSARSLVAALPGGFETVRAIRFGIEPFIELGANLGSLSGSRVDSPCSCRAILKSAPVTLLQSPLFG